MKELAAVKSLEALYLGNNAITDSGLKELAALKNLKTLNVHRTKVTAAGMKALREVLPRCEIRD